MILYALDTDMLSLFEGGHPIVTMRVLSVLADQLFITSITVRERLDGWYGLLGRVKTSADEEAIYARLVDTVRICASVRILPYTIGAITRFQQLQKMKLNVGLMDLRIAAVALEHNAILVTRNLRDFSRVPGLRFEDWSQAES